ncbi:MAG: MSMEG_0568 family radical SAM protein [Desulfovibrio sp.]|nr:MSMEG_0568 family radical SAM protein [Desulfovibrio sp.]
MSMQLADYIALQSQGAKVNDLGAVRRGGAGPADARAFIIDGHPVMIPVLSCSATDSDYEFIPDGSSWRLESGGQSLCRAQAVPRPAFYEGQTTEGIPYAKIALLHGRDCLASTVIQECVRYNDIRTRCRFCAIGASLDRGATIHTKTPEQLSEVALAAKRMDHVTHVTLTAGTTADPDDGAIYLGRCAQAIRDATALPVEVQFEPLRDKKLYSRLKDMGVCDVGLHVESFDEKTRHGMAPGKAEVSLERYFEAFADAVAVFGRNKVSTYVILGLGENPELTLEGCRQAILLGVYPVLVPLRPLLDSFLAKSRPADPQYLAKMYRAVGAILEEQGLRAEESTAGCVRCRACSLLQFTEKEARVDENAWQKNEHADGASKSLTDEKVVVPPVCPPSCAGTAVPK